MAYTLIQLLPLILASMLYPTWIMLVLSLLTTANGRARASAFVGGIVAVRLLLGVIFGFIAAAYISNQRGRTEGIIVSALLLGSGVLMWGVAIRQFFVRNEPGALIGKWMDLLTRLTPMRAFGLGTLLAFTSVRAWVLLLAAIGVIAEAGLSAAQGILAFLLYVLGADLLLFAPILAALWMPARFDTLSQWLRAHDNQITIGASLIVGSFFLWYGASSLVSALS